MFTTYTRSGEGYRKNSGLAYLLPPSSTPRNSDTVTDRAISFSSPMENTLIGLGRFSDIIPEDISPRKSLASFKAARCRSFASA